MKFIRLLQLDFLPRSVDLGLLILRLWLGVSLLTLHGWSKLTGYSQMADKFPDPFGFGSPTSLAMAIFGEVVCAALLALGLFTRFAAAGLVITMATAFIFAHKSALSGPTSGELAYTYLAGFVALFIAGAGKLSLDAALGAKRA